MSIDSLWFIQFLALMKKNFLLKKRNKRVTLMEIGYPLYWLLLLFMFQQSLPTDTSISQIDSFPSIPLLSITSHCTTSVNSNSLLSRCEIAYAPQSSEFITNTMNRLSDRFIDILPFNNNKEIEDYYLNNPGKLWAAIIWNNEDSLLFDENINNNNNIYYNNEYSYNNIEFNNIQYTIRMNQSQLYQKTNSELISSGFISLQNSLQECIINQKLYDNGINKTIDLNTSTESFPQPYIDLANRIYDILWAIMFPMIFSYVLQGLVSGIVTEKKDKLKEGMKMMGLKESVYWISWLSIQSIINLFICIVFIIFAYILKLFVYTPIWICFLSFFLYSTSIVAIAFFISVFFNNPKTASSIGWMIFFLQIIIAAGIQYFLFHKKNTWAIFIIYISSLIIPPLPLTQLAIYMATAEFNHGGISLFYGVPSFYPIWIAFFFLIGNIIIYLFMAWYFSNILPGEYGTRKSIFFLCYPSYYRKKKNIKNTNNDDTQSLLINDNESNDDIEISIDKLVKIYPKSIFSWGTEDITAVNNLSFSIKQGEVFALLGHNGAGKSTTIAMLTGLFPPTSGDAYIQNNSINNNMDTIRKMLGVCPQHDILFPQLNAVEHLELFSALKGTKRNEITQSINEILSQVGLEEIEYTKPTKSFSGGMKRKLSVAIALIGNSSIIFLDECTAGMDPLSRRKIWNLIQEKKQGRTIVLTTHFMEEADILGDRIGIMSKGTLKVLGTSVELKNSFGVGYYLSFTKDDDFNIDNINILLNKYFKGKEIFENETDTEINYKVPNNCKEYFADFFLELDNNLKENNIKSYGIYTTTLEEVFLKIAEEEENEDNEDNIDEICNNIIIDDE